MNNNLSRDDDDAAMLWRFSHLKQNNIVDNRVQLKTLVDKHGFPPGFLLSPNARAWFPRDVRAWVRARAQSDA